MTTTNNNPYSKPQNTDLWNTYMRNVNAREPIVEEGEYEATLVNAKLELSKNANKPQVRVDYEIAGQEKRVSSYFQLDLDKCLKHLVRWADILKIHLPPDPGELPGVLERVTNAKFFVQIRVLDNNGFTFALLLRRLDGNTEQRPCGPDHPVLLNQNAAMPIPGVNSQPPPPQAWYPQPGQQVVPQAAQPGPAMGAQVYVGQATTGLPV